MKIFLLAVIFCSSLMASKKSAIEAFLADAKVNARISEEGPAYQTGEIEATFLRESCGYLGCITDYLISAPLMSTNLNLPSKSVLAKIQLTGDTVMLIQVLPEYTTSIVTK